MYFTCQIHAFGKLNIVRCTVHLSFGGPVRDTVMSYVWSNLHMAPRLTAIKCHLRSPHEVTQLNIVEVCVVMASAVRRADGTSELSLTFYMWSTAPCTSRSTMSGSRAAGRSSTSPPRLRLPFPPGLRIDRALAGRGQELGHEFSESSTTSRSTLLPEIFLALREQDDHEAMDLH
jgi:hypothetical protein